MDDFKKEWPKLREQLAIVSKQALTLAQKGEQELFKLSRKGKWHMDSTALQLKKEHFYHLIGKEYVKAKCPGPHSPQMARWIKELKNIDEELRAVRRRLKAPGTGRTQKGRGNQRGSDS